MIKPRNAKFTSLSYKLNTSIVEEEGRITKYVSKQIGFDIRYK